MRLHDRARTALHGSSSTGGGGDPGVRGSGDDSSLGRALLLIGWVDGGHRGDQHGMRLRRRSAPHSLQAVDLADFDMRRARSRTRCTTGRRRFAEAIDAVTQLLDDEALEPIRAGELSRSVPRRARRAGRATSTEARDARRVERGQIYDELGPRARRRSHVRRSSEDVEFLAGDLIAAEANAALALRGARARLHGFERIWQAGRANLPRRSIRQGRFDEAAEWAECRRATRGSR